MLQYAIVLLLLNYYKCGLSVPVNPPTPNVSLELGKALEDLANKCENKFLSTQIKSQLNVCNVTTPPYGINELKCLIFYDINIQLCSSEKVSVKSVILNEEFTAKVVGTSNASIVCKNAIYWKFLEIPNLHKYKSFAEQVFGNGIQCNKVCSIGLSAESDFFCKYADWGYSLMSKEPKPTTGSENNEDLKQRNIPHDDIGISQLGVTPGNSKKTDNSDTSIVLPITNDIHNDVIGSKDINNSKAKETPNSIQIPPIVPNGNDLHSDAGTDKLKPSQVPNSGTGYKLNENAGKSQNAESIPLDFVPLTSAKDISSNLPQQSETDGNGDVGDPDDGADVPLPGEAETPVIGSIDNNNGDSDNNEAIEKKVLNADEFAEEDHFFSFFLTAVLLVILLYVLYHNKHKVSKVVLGLIVEGRQSGRRRNSRGHSYRRLDTLEQAMTSNSSAPPTKIIY